VTAVDVDALDAARAAATAGPWACNAEPVTHQSPEGHIWSESLRATGEWADEVADTFEHPDAALIVAAVNSLPDLLAEVRRGRALREHHDELRHRLKALVDEWDAMARNLHHVPVAEAYADVVIGLRAVLAAVDGEQ